MWTEPPHLAIDGFADTWEDAEHLAAVALRCMGFDVAVTGPGADAGIDVAGHEVVAQVKHLDRKVGRPDVQRLVGAADGRMTAFFSLSGYSDAAVAYADERGVALFWFTRDGEVHAANALATGWLPDEITGGGTPVIAAPGEPTLDDRRAAVEGDIRALRRWRKALVTVKGAGSRRVRAFDRDMARVERAHAKVVVTAGGWRRRRAAAAVADAERRIDAMVRRHRIEL